VGALKGMHFLCSKNGRGEPRANITFPTGGRDEHGRIVCSIMAALEENTFIAIIDENGQRHYLYVPRGHALIITSAAYYEDVEYLGVVQNIRFGAATKEPEA
jgi:hypothetical protein